MIPLVEVRTGHEAWAGVPERSRSPQVDFGVWWTWPGLGRGRWRVTWIERTGELYAAALDRSGRFVVLGTFASRDEVESCMEGWAEDGVADNSLAWAVGRALAPRQAAP